MGMGGESRTGEEEARQDWYGLGMGGEEEGQDRLVRMLVWAGMGAGYGMGIAELMVWVARFSVRRQTVDRACQSSVSFVSLKVINSGLSHSVLDRSLAGAIACAESESHS